MADDGSRLAVLAGRYITLTDDQREAFAAYRDLLLEWNGRFNLTAFTEPDAVDERLFLDALRMVPAVDAIGRPNPRVRPIAGSPPSVNLVDIGTGAGFPGLPLKIVRPALNVTLVEATGKKVQFLDAVIAELGLSGIVAIHGRAEDLGTSPAYRGAFDVATARGVSSLPALVELAAPLLRRNGVGIFPKGVDLAEELEAGRRAARIVGVTIEGANLVPDSETRLVIVRKTAETPDRYPRRPGIPAREPLGAAPPEDRRPSRR